MPGLTMLHPASVIAILRCDGEIDLLGAREGLRQSELGGDGAAFLAEKCLVTVLK